MILEIILILSIFIQIAAIFLVLPLISTTRRREAWMLISFGMVLMCGRRMLSLIQGICPQKDLELCLWFEGFGLLASICFFFSILFIRNYFRHSQKVEKALRESREDLRYLSSHDILTGLYNRNYFEMLISRISGQGNFPLSILIADVDNLKCINDQHGHAAGDDLLRQVAKVFANVFRETDRIARIGGDEFSVLLPGTDESEAQKILQRIQEELEKQPDIEGLPRLGLSVGIAVAHNAEEILQSIRLADKLMYENKDKHKKAHKQSAEESQQAESITHMPAHPVR